MGGDRAVAHAWLLGVVSRILVALCGVSGFCLLVVSAALGWFGVRAE